MRFSTLLSIAGGIASAQAAVSTGFNYGATMSDGTVKEESDYEAEFKAAKALSGTNGEFTSARLYTMIQGTSGTDPIAAIQAAINTKTTLLLGLWASVDQDTFNNEISALTNAINQYGTDFTDLVVGISVGSEDLYRISPTGIENDSGIGQQPGTLVDFIKQTRDAIKGTSLSNAPVGHVDTWNSWVNQTNFVVTDACDWLGVDEYPYFQTTVTNPIGDAQKIFWDSYNKTLSVSKGKEVWVTETGWPVSGDKSGEAVASIANAETYWQEVGCALIGQYNTWYYTLIDDLGSTPSPSFGIVGGDLTGAPLYDLQCKKIPSTSEGGSTPSTNGTAPGHASPTGSSGSSAASASASASVSAGGEPNSASRIGAAAGVGILAVFGFMVAL